MAATKFTQTYDPRFDDIGGATITALSTDIEKALIDLKDAGITQNVLIAAMYLNLTKGDNSLLNSVEIKIDEIASTYNFTYSEVVKEMGVIF